MKIGEVKMQKINNLQSKVNESESQLEYTWFELKAWCNENRLGVSALRSHLIGNGIREDNRLPSGHWTDWHMMSIEDNLDPDGRKLAEEVAKAALNLENALQTLHDATSYHVFTRSLRSVLCGDGVVERDNRRYDSLSQAVDVLRTRIESGTKKKSAVIGFVFHGTNEGGFDENGELHGEPDVTVIASNKTLEVNHGLFGNTISGLMQQPFVEV